MTTPPPEEPTADVSGPATAPPAPAPAPPKERNRRRWWIAGVAAGAAVLVLLVCGGFAFAVAGFRTAVRSAEQQERGYERIDAACVELERRLNKVAPPGSTSDLKGRAAAIRAENAAVRPFLTEFDDLDEARGHRGYGRWAQEWFQLMEARTAYADALDRQAGGGEPAFFLPPVTDRGRSVADRLEAGPRWCAASVRRLAAPDL